MVLPTPTPRASTRSRVAATPAPPTTRMTRLRTREAAAPSPATSTRTTGILAKGKEGFRKVSDKVKEKEKEMEKHIGVGHYVMSLLTV